MLSTLVWDNTRHGAGLRNFKNILFYAGAYFFALLNAGFADVMAFDMKPLGKMNRIDIQLATGFGSGSVRGTFSQVVGKINFSVREPGNSTGQVLMDARTLRFGYGKVNVDAHDPEWLDSSQFPRVSFSMESLSDFNWLGERMQANANGNLTIKGKSIPLSVPVNLRYLRAERRVYDGKNGDILYLTGEFPLSRGEFGINTGTALDTVLDSLTVKIQLMAGSDAVRPFLPCRLFGGSP